MSKDVAATKEAKEPVVSATQSFFFPETGTTIRAIDLIEATIKHKQIVNKKEEVVNG